MIEWLLIGLLASAIVVAASLSRGTASFDNLLYDGLSEANRPAADPDILIVAIDDRSLEALGKWQWDRKLHAQLLERLQANEPRSIIFDLLLSEPGNPSSDAALAAAMRAGPAPVLIPLHFDAPGSNGRAYDTVLPERSFARAGQGIGHANVVFDADGIVRRASLCFRVEDDPRRWPHLVELAYREAGSEPSPAFRRAGCGAEYLIPFSERGSFAEISFVDILKGQVPAELLRGRHVIIGATATGLGDNFPAANGDEGLLSGAEIMANMFGALRRGDFIEPTDQDAVLAFSVAPLWLLMIGFLLWKPHHALFATSVSIVLIVAVSIGLLRNSIWLAPGGALLGVSIVYPLWGWRRLQAMSDFFKAELGAFDRESKSRPLPLANSGANDRLGRQSEALARSIDDMRDLRRFVSDTLADLPDPMFVTDPDEMVTLTNDELDSRVKADLTGMSLASALDWIVTTGDRGAVDRYIANCGTEECVRFHSQLDRTFVMRRSKILSDSGRLRGHIHYLTDITELASAEAEREIVLQLLSHDMRAPQSTIIAILNGEVDADAKKRIERNARRTMQLAQEFVDIARMYEADFEGGDILLPDLLHEVADSLWPLANERGIKFAFDDRSDGAFVFAERDLLFRAFCNLIDNAIKFSPDAGTITIMIERKLAGISVAISDDGPGIPPDILPRLFRRFASGGRHQGRTSGAGLGLTFVQRVIERHKGTVTAINRAPSGATFTVGLPEAEEPDRPIRGPGE